MLRTENRELNPNLLARIGDTQTQVFRLLFRWVWGFLGFYCVFYAYAGGSLSFWTVAVGFTILAPLQLWLDKSGRENLARVFFLFSCNAYIYLTSLGMGHRIAAEYYYLPALLFPLLIFDSRQKRLIFGCLSITGAFALFNIFGGSDFVPSDWIARLLPFDLIKNVNFFGAILITFVAIRVFLSINNDLKEMILEHAEGETQNLKAFKLEVQKSSQNRNLLQEVIDATPSVVFVKDLQGRYILCNKFYASLFGKEPKEIEGKTIFDFLPTQAAEWMTQNDNKALESEHGTISEEMLPTPRGMRAHLVSLYPIRNSDGETFALGGIITDIQDSRDQRDQYEAKIQSQNALLEGVLDHLPSAVIVNDLKGEHRVKLANNKASEFFGIPLNEVIGKRAKETVNAKAHIAESIVQSAINKKTAVHIEREKIVAPTGDLWLEIDLVPILDKNGTPDLLLEIFSNVTEKVAGHELAEKERAKAAHSSKLASLGEMAAGMAHEINNPLAIVAGNVPLLKKFKDNEEKFNTRVESILKATLRIEKIVKGLRRFSRGNSLQPFKVENFRNIVNEALVLTESKAKRDDTPIRIEVPEQLLVFCDALEVEQVLINLINNGVDAIRGTQERWVKVAAFERGNRVILQVTDSGKGIDLETEKKIFDPFFTTKPVGEGTGLGLSIARGILDRHHATISINRDSPHTCFEVSFPLAAELESLQKKAA